MPFTLPSLPYAANALEPAIDTMTMEIHHGRHHKAYVDNLNKALEIDKEYEDAMSYLNLLIRERADLDESAEDYKKDVETADGWVQKALDTKKMKAAKEAAKTQGGITPDAPK